MAETDECLKWAEKEIMVIINSTEDQKNAMRKEQLRVA